MLFSCNDIENTEPVLFHSGCVGISGGSVLAHSYPVGSWTVRFLKPYRMYMHEYSPYHMSTIWLYSHVHGCMPPGFNAAAAWQMVPATAALCRSRLHDVTTCIWWNCETLEKGQILKKRLETSLNSLLFWIYLHLSWRSWSHLCLCPGLYFFILSRDPALTVASCLVATCRLYRLLVAGGQGQTVEPYVSRRKWQRTSPFTVGELWKIKCQEQTWTHLNKLGQNA